MRSLGFDYSLCMLIAYLADGSFQEVEFVVEEELLDFLLLEAAHIAELQRVLLLLAEHPLLYCKLLLDHLCGLILLEESLEGLEVEMVGEGEDAEEEVVVEEDHGLVALLNRMQSTTMGAKWVLMLEK